ncbi:MAG: prolipoprotein diacylglyceryl transferase [Bdellovibrionota bacterium]
MFPLVHLTPLPAFPSYGLFLALAHFAGIALLLTLVKRRGLPVSKYVDLIFVVLFSALIGARAAYVLGHLAEFHGRWLHIALVWEGGLSFHGGFFTAFPSYLAFLYFSRLPILESSDLAAPVLPLAMSIIRLGCFCAGCCYGLPTHLPWGMMFHSNQIPPELAAEHLHPSQLYESAALLLLALFLLRELRLRRFPVGTLGILSIFLYAWIRLGLDFLRGDLIHGFLGLEWLTFSQASALLMIVVGTMLLIWVRKLATFPLFGKTRK